MLSEYSVTTSLSNSSTGVRVSDVLNDGPDLILSFRNRGSVSSRESRRLTFRVTS